MTVFLIIDETNFHQPNFVAELLQNKEYDFIGCALVVKVPRKNNIERYMMTNFHYLKWNELFKLSFRKAKHVLFSWLGIGKPQHFYTVRSVLNYYNIPFFSVKNDINRKIYLNKIKKLKPHIILSSNSLYFKKELLSIPAYCINRHSSLLPSYGGLWPLFQALRNNERYVGVTVHIMSKKIDDGEILVQRKIKVYDSDTVDSLYERCFAISASVCIEALNLLSNKKEYFPLKKPINKVSYFSFPTKEEWGEFRKKKKKFV